MDGDARFGVAGVVLGLAGVPLSQPGPVGRRVSLLVATVMGSVIGTAVVWQVSAPETIVF